MTALPSAVSPGVPRTSTVSSPISRRGTASPWTGFYVAKMMYGIYACAERGTFASGTTVVAVITG